MHTFLADLLGLRSSAKLAVLIDGENIAATMAVHVLAEAGKHGSVALRRVYGDWSAPSMHPWQLVVSHYGMRAVHQHLPHKNAADLALAVDAVDLFHQEIRRFCLVSGDSDYTPLVRWLTEHGCWVLVIGQPDTPLTLQRAGSCFLSTDQLHPQISWPKKAGQRTDEPVPLHVVSTPEQPPRAVPRVVIVATETSLQTLLVSAYADVVQEKGEQWVTTADLGVALQKREATFNPKMHGCATLRKLLQQHDALFVVQETGGGQAKILLKAWEELEQEG